MVRVRQYSTAYSKVSQKKAKSEAACIVTDEKKAKKLEKLKSMFMSISTVSRAARVRAVFSMTPVPPEDLQIKCPACENTLTQQDVQKGFSKHYYDFKTTCPACGFRFMTSSVFRVADEEERVPWLCENQTMQAFHDWYGNVVDDHDEDSLLKELVQKEPTIVWNIMRYAIELKTTVLGWIKKRFPDVEINWDEDFYRDQVQDDEEEEDEEEESSSSSSSEQESSN